MAEPGQHSSVFSGNAGAAIQATNSGETTIAATSTPVKAANTWGQVGDAFEVTVNATDLEAAHSNGGARLYGVNLHARVAKASGAPSDVRVHIYVNGAPMTNPTFREISVKGTDPSSEFTMNTAVQLVATDKVDVWVENITNTNNVTLVEGATLLLQS